MGCSKKRNKEIILLVVGGIFIVSSLLIFSLGGRYAEAGETNIWAILFVIASVIVFLGMIVDVVRYERKKD